jgi:serine/threonine protein kinase
MGEREIFLTAREKSDPASRMAFLDEACAGDPALRKRVERLLRADAGADSLLDVPAAPRPGTPNPRVGPALEKGSEAALSFLAPPGLPDSLGRLGHYEALEVLGQGGFGIVFRAFDEVLQRVVAIKVLAPELATTSPARKRFLREARAAAQVRHENVVQIYAVEEQPLPYLVMEFIPGETLQQRLDRTGPLDVPEVLRIGRQIAEGLAAAHAKGLIHRDVKPANVLIERGPHAPVKLTDFGLARAADDASMSQSGLVAGTPLYMSPEQARGERLDHRSDLFSLGSVLYVMSSGRPPFRAANTLAVLKRVSEDTPRPIVEIIPEVPPWLCEIIARLHAKAPDARLQSAHEVAGLLGNSLARSQQPNPSLGLASPGTGRGEPPTVAAALAAPSDGREQPGPHVTGGRYRWAAAAAVLLLLFGGLTLTEATGVSKLRGTVVRLFTSTGVLVVETDDPGVRITVEGEEVVIAGAGVKELRVKPGKYRVQASKDGKVVREELVTVTRNGRQVVRVSREPRRVAKRGYALDFDGVKSLVTIPSLSRDEDSPITIEAFVTVGSTRGAALVRIEGKFPCQMHGWPTRQAATEWAPNGLDHRGAKMDAAHTPPLRPGRRAHVAVQFDRKSIQLFIDGRRVNSAPRRGGPGAGKLRGAALGGHGLGRMDAQFSGRLDEVRISKAARYAGDFTPQQRFSRDKDTLALYHCDEGTGERLTDSSGNGHHGKIVGAKWVKIVKP